MMSDREKMMWALVVFLCATSAMLSFTVITMVGNKALPFVTNGVNWFTDMVRRFVVFITGG